MPILILMSLISSLLNSGFSSNGDNQTTRSQIKGRGALEAAVISEVELESAMRKNEKAEKEILSWCLKLQTTKQDQTNLKVKFEVDMQVLKEETSYSSYIGICDS